MNQYINWMTHLIIYLLGREHHTDKAIFFDKITKTDLKLFFAWTFVSNLEKTVKIFFTLNLFIYLFLAFIKCLVIIILLSNTFPFPNQFFHFTILLNMK